MSSYITSANGKSTSKLELYIFIPLLAWWLALPLTKLVMGSNIVTEVHLKLSKRVWIVVPLKNVCL